MGYDNMRVTEYLYIGCISHIAVVIMLSMTWFLMMSFNVDPFGCFGNCVIGFQLCSALFFASWCVFGCILYSGMIETNVSNERCSDMLISWVILKFWNHCC